MKKMMRSLKKNRKKGFTLVELIVVLVILAILAALLIPALTGYIDKAKKKQVVAETRQAVMAAQTLADEKYGEDGGDLDGTDNDNKEAVENLADVNGKVDSFNVNGGKVIELVYKNGLSCTYTYDTATKKGTYSDPT